MSPPILSVQDIQTEVNALLPPNTPQGEHLDEITIAFIEYALRSAVTVLDREEADRFAETAVALGATVAQLHEILVLVSGLGVHSLMVGSPMLGHLAAKARDPLASAPLTADQRALRNKYVGESNYWRRFEEATPGFLDALLRLSPSGFEAFFEFCALPWQNPTVPALTKELISVAVDASPSHRFLPGVRVHVVNALALACGRNALFETLDIAARAPVHSGVR